MGCLCVCQATRLSARRVGFASTAYQSQVGGGDALRCLSRFIDHGIDVVHPETSQCRDDLGDSASGGRVRTHPPAHRSRWWSWDPRDGHQHWHFTDFARYRLLDETMHVAVRSGKESFCLANTHAIDYTLPFASWQPGNTDLHTACGDVTALAVRQVLDVGSGDTYAQDLPGQAFDITDLPNGVYFIEIAANPEGTLYELDSSNNTSLRRIVLGGEPGGRTVEVAPYTDGPA